ncbi:hypothetical protein F5Y19DRAFT_480174 [Xylariaceae sp. FL1651]|nr:hypothetical protein F5Y19DRAFT_480174 [Xylariaceae sp. FL1651]
MHLTSIVATALLPLLAIADDTSTATSTMTMTKYVTISKVATSSIYAAANATSSFYLPTGTGYSSGVVPTTTSAGEDSGSPTGSSPTVSPTIDNGNGAGSLSAFAFAGVAGMALAALI